MNRRTSTQMLRRFVGAAGALLVAQLLAAGQWQPLFNGTDLSGWKQINGSAPYTVEDGSIVGTTVTGSPNSFLATEQTYGDFILEFEIKQEVGPSNTGVQFRSLSMPEHENGRVHGYQCEIDPTERAWSGGIYDEARRGWLYPLSLNPDARTAYRYGEWNRVRIEAIGTSLRTFINGAPVSHVVDGLTPSGLIALQVHSIRNADEAGRRVLWRNIRIQTSDLEPAPAPANPIFVRSTEPNSVHGAESAQGWRLLWDGESADGWQAATGGELPADVWKIENGELVVLAGANRAKDSRGGDIVTKEQFGAFELQLEFKLTEGANSGIKYYVYSPDAGSRPVGLEFQLLDDAKHPDAARGIDGNRKIAAVYDVLPRLDLTRGLGIIPGTGRWMHARITAHADGRVEHWLNGMKVVEYNRRSPEFAAAVAKSKFANTAGFGQAERGPILLQDHGDEVRFRSIKIRALPSE